MRYLFLLILMIGNLSGCSEMMKLSSPSQPLPMRPTVHHPAPPPDIIITDLADEDL